MNSFRPPAVPLVAHDPYFSIWSFADRLTDDTTRHWTGTSHAMLGLARIDGKVYRLCGSHWRLPAMTQTSVVVLPTRTIYRMEADGVQVTLTFLTPALPHDLEWLGRPVTYLIFDVCSQDGQPHEVSLYWDMNAEVAVNHSEDVVVWSRFQVDDLAVLRCSSRDQRILERSGDNRRIDWGHAYFAVPEKTGKTYVGAAKMARDLFVEEGVIPRRDDLEQMSESPWCAPVMAAYFPLGQVGEESVQRHVILAYDDLYSLEYLHRRVRPWWRRNGMEAADLLAEVESAFPTIRGVCEEYDAALMKRLREAGGEKYAALCALAFRQCLAAHKLAADHDGSPLYLSKENFSNGCIGTVDVTYPSSPFFLAFNPKLLLAQLTPILEYAQSGRWKFPFAPHDLGTYPLANGQVYGGGEKTEKDQMPVEECGNMLLLVAAVAIREGTAKEMLQWWPLLQQWASYLCEKGLDPENQLCTDDFAGHLAHNTNLSLKAILAIAAYAKLAGLVGKADEARQYRKAAEKMASCWLEMAEDGDHYRLTFDKPGTWSQKYNLVWDRLLGLDLFPTDVARKEVAFYQTKQNRYGLPLDSRDDYTKLDWIVWSASLSDSQETFRALVDPLFDWANTSVSRVPLTDWYRTTGDGAQVAFQARSVVGGLFIQLLNPAPAIS